MVDYQKSDGLKYILKQRWLNNSGEFPKDKGNFVEHYTNIETYMDEKIHDEVMTGAASKGDGVLTNHGVKHVQMVIRYAYKLLGESKLKELIGYEIFILLLSIHFHDVGNIYGRDKHEKKIADIMDDLGDKIPLDNAERRIVVAIAEAHGGNVDTDATDKDTLRLLQVFENCNGIKIRPALLAAILRFADELADDNTRASRYVTLGISNRIHHEYSKSLHPITFIENTIEFVFDISYDLSVNSIKTPKGTRFLYDEILYRLRKCMCELEYCRKYADSFIRISAFNVTVNILKKQNTFRLHKNFKFSLRLLGYPNYTSLDISSFVDNPTSLPYKSGKLLRADIADHGGIKKWLKIRFL
jgi:hypothetical protein